MSNSVAPLFMETIDRLGAGHLFGGAAESRPPSGESRASNGESRAETTERLRLVAARSGEPADLRDYLNALAAAVPAMSPDACRFVADVLGVDVAPAFRGRVPSRLP
ncbi:MAG: hypothetical protein ABJB47_10350 [Actinomycetota bacterium]